VAATFSLTIAAALGAVAWECRRFAQRQAGQPGDTLRDVVTRNLWLASLIVLIAAVSSSINKV